MDLSGEQPRRRRKFVLLPVEPRAERVALLERLFGLVLEFWCFGESGHIHLDYTRVRELTGHY